MIRVEVGLGSHQPVQTDGYKAVTRAEAQAEEGAAILKEFSYLYGLGNEKGCCPRVERPLRATPEQMGTAPQ